MRVSFQNLRGGSSQVTDMKMSLILSTSCLPETTCSSITRLEMFHHFFGSGFCFKCSNLFLRTADLSLFFPERRGYVVGDTIYYLYEKMLLSTFDKLLVYWDYPRLISIVYFNYFTREKMV